jgi:hypothetical protein
MSSALILRFVAGSYHFYQRNSGMLYGDWDLIFSAPAPSRPFFIRWLTTLERTTRPIPGNQIQANSFFITDHPRMLKKDLIPIGETWMGVQGRKYRSDEREEKKATPRLVTVPSSRLPS